MNTTERRSLHTMLDNVRVNRTLFYSWVFVRHGPDNDAFLGIWRWRADAQRAAFDLRRTAERTRLIEGHVWFLRDEFVFRCPDPDDPELRYSFARNLTEGGFRDIHPWLREGRIRFVHARGDHRDPATWFDDPEVASRVAAELGQLGVGGPSTVAAGGAGGAGDPPGGGCHAGLDVLDGLSDDPGLDVLEEILD